MRLAIDDDVLHHRQIPTRRPDVTRAYSTGRAEAGTLRLFATLVRGAFPPLYDFCNTTPTWRKCTVSRKHA